MIRIQARLKSNRFSVETAKRLDRGQFAIGEAGIAEKPESSRFVIARLQIERNRSFWDCRVRIHPPTVSRVSRGCDWRFFDAAYESWSHFRVSRGEQSWADVAINDQL